MIKQLKTLVNYYLLAKYRSKKFKIDGKANIFIEAHFVNSNRRDPDNLFVKPIIDAIVKFGVLPDDNGDVVESLTLISKTRMESDQIIIKINE